jgi:hypothetical protein
VLDSWSTDRVTIWKSIQQLCLFVTVNTLSKQNTKITRMGWCVPDALLLSKRFVCEIESIYGTGLDNYLLQIKIHCCKANHNKLQTKCKQPGTIFIILSFLPCILHVLNKKDAHKSLK